MDTHIAPQPALEPEDTAFARLPGETETPLHPESGLEHLAPESGERLPTSKRASSKRHGLVLAGGAVLVVGVGVFLVSPFNHVQPMPRFAASVRDTVGLKPPAVLAPSASLAKVTLPPTPAASRSEYAAAPRDQEVAELLSLHGGTSAPVTGTRPIGKPDLVSGQTPAIGKTAQADRPDVPPGYVASEPGAVQPAGPVSHATPTRGRSLYGTETAVSQVTPDRFQETPVPPSARSSQPSAVVSPVMRVTPIPHDAITVGQNLHASRMTPSDQVAVLGLVTEMASMVQHLREQNAQLRDDFGKASADTSARLSDFERRLLLAEARRAVNAANDVDAIAAQSSATPAPPAAKAVPVSLTRASAVLPPGTGSETAKLYRVQAASPGLALLAQVDRGGGDGAQMQVVVGDNIPDYGRVKSISQRGTTWLVSTEHGEIQ